MHVLQIFSDTIVTFGAFKDFCKKNLLVRGFEVRGWLRVRGYRHGRYAIVILLRANICSNKRATMSWDSQNLIQSKSQVPLYVTLLSIELNFGKLVYQWPLSMSQSKTRKNYTGSMSLKKYSLAGVQRRSLGKATASNLHVKMKNGRVETLDKKTNI